jgi:cytochrome b561
MGWMNKNSMGEIISNGLAEKDVTIDKDTAGSIAKQVRRPMWGTHIIAGYILVGLYLIRMAMFAVQGVTFISPFKKDITGYQRFRSFVYLLFYVLVAASLTTGLLIEFGPGSIHELSEEIHKLSLYYMVTFIALHIGGVVLADGGKERGIISKMVSGESANN